LGVYWDLSEVQMDVKQVAVNLSEFCRNAMLTRVAHFAAARRSKRLQSLFGVPVVVINIILGSVFFFSLRQELPDIAKWCGAFFALGSAAAAGIQTYFNFHRTFEAHRKIANRYSALGREAERLLSMYQDGLIELGPLAEKVDALLTAYNQVNAEAEPFPTTDWDFRRALRREKERQRGLRERGVELLRAIEKSSSPDSSAETNAQQAIGRERRERVSQLESSGDA
jgi:hypothetical protein